MSESKRAAGRRAAELVTDGMALGLGTGSTTFFALERLSERIKSEGLRIRGVATSRDTEEKARAFGIQVIDLEGAPTLDLTIDGADEVDKRKQMIKGGGGALLREKIVATASKEMVVVIGRDKLVDVLGRGYLLPVEVTQFGWSQSSRRLETLGCKALLRSQPGGDRFVTDNGNYILDCRFDGIPDPASLESRINQIAGVVDNGLFVGLAGRVVIGDADGRTEIW
jgi:ribose 5-phosphate isomerase A